MAAPIKKISKLEKEFARLMAEVDLGPAEAARKAFGWRCEKGSKEEQAAKDLARSIRVSEEVRRIKDKLNREAQAVQTVTTAGEIDTDKILKFCAERLELIRDDPRVKAATRLLAINTLEKVHDPGSDINLILSWIDICWRFLQAHCPSCHNTFPLNQITNKVLEEWRKSKGSPPDPKPTDIFDCRMELIKKAEKRKTPHPSQVKALEAPERHIVGLAAARAGKSWLMALFALMGLLIPGVEIWLISRTYEEAGWEVIYLKQFLKTLFYPHENHVVKINEDKTNGELRLETKWGSLLKIRSAKAKGSITGSELELALIAEPGWVPEDIYEEIRARMSSRLGRILAFGTPKGTAGFIGRMVRSTGRDPKTGKIIRWRPEDRLISNDCPWGSSMLIYHLRPEDNPEYVKSELSAARMELSDTEYQSEFQGEMVADDGLKFANVGENNLAAVPRSFFAEAKFVLGIDQGPTNFAACLVAFDGKRVVPCWEFFDKSEKTMAANLKYLRKRVPLWINVLGGRPNSWRLTITDKDPQLWQIFTEMETNNMKWPTEIVERHENNRRAGDNWRKENAEFVNNCAVRTLNDDLPILIFHQSDYMSKDESENPGALLLHDQVMNAQDKPEIREKESGRLLSDKGWQITDTWRQDHVVDAWYFAMWTVFSGQLMSTKDQEVSDMPPDSPFEEARKGLEYIRARDEARELMGYTKEQSVPKEQEIFQRYFGRRRHSGSFIPGGYYSDES